jgi:YD repeat-containing protein
MLKALITFLAVFLISSLVHAEQRYFYDSLGQLAAERRRDCQPVSTHSATAPKMS